MEIKARANERASTKQQAGDRPGAESALQRLDEACLTVRARRRQRLAISIDQVETLYLVRSGQLLVTASLPARRQIVLGILYPGDVFRTSFAPPMADISLTSTGICEVGRVRWTIAKQIARADAELDAALEKKCASQQARLALHLAIIGTLTGEERAASYMVDLALRVGQPVPGGIAVDMALSRSDIAEHLSLNADTLSRIMSRLKARNLFVLAGRGRAIIKDFGALCALTPLASVLQDMTPNSAIPRSDRPQKR